MHAFGSIAPFLLVDFYLEKKKGKKKKSIQVRIQSPRNYVKFREAFKRPDFWSPTPSWWTYCLCIYNVIAAHRPAPIPISMYGPQYSAHGSQPFYRPSCSQVIDPAQLPGYPETEVNSELNLGGFSGGSSLQYNNHACHLPVTLGSSTGTSSNLTTHATGPVITGAPADVLGHSQPIQNLRQPWQLHPAQAHTQPTPIPFYPNASSAPDRNKRTSKSRADHSSMAVLLPPEGTSPPLSLSFTHNAETMSHESTALLSAFALDTEASVQNSCVRIAREKKHACWMCHKSFDRPSTLRKVSIILRTSTLFGHVIFIL